MKNIKLIGAAMVLLAVACSKEQQQNENTTGNGLNVTACVEQPVKTSLSGETVKWSAGDRIYITNGSNSAIYEAATSAASTKFTKVSGDDLVDGDVYAYYPAGNVTDNGFDNTSKTFEVNIPATQKYVANGFADGVNPMVTKSEIVDGSLELNFKNVLSFVQLKVINTNAGTNLSSITLTSSTADLNGTTNVGVDSEGYPTVGTLTSGTKTIEVSGINAGLSSASAVSVYVAVPVAELGSLTINATTSEAAGCYTQDKASSGTLTAERSTIYGYNAVDIKDFGHRTLISEAAANCYMIDADIRSSIIIPLSQALAGWDAIKALEPDDTFDKTKITSGTRTIDVRWLDGTGTIELDSINDATMTLNFTDCTNGSNACVDLKNDSEIVWSWHMWFTDYKPTGDLATTANGEVYTFPGAAFQEGGLYYGKVMMDRNLGATATGITGAISQPTTNAEGETLVGLYYQFGRKDPFLKANQSVAKATSTTYGYAVSVPKLFITSPYDDVPWSVTDDSKITDPWNALGVKSAFDPCPAGWRIPANSDTMTNNVWDGITASCYYGSTKIYCIGYSFGGSWIQNGGFINPGDGYLSETFLGRVYTWGASPTAYKCNGQYAAMTGGEPSIYTTSTKNGQRGFGMLVRCVKD